LIAERANTDAEWLEATHWYRLAADSGNAAANTRLAEVQESRLSSVMKHNAAGQGSARDAEQCPAAPAA